MGSFSIWHWLILLVGIVIPIIFIVRPAPPGENRFGSPGVEMNFTGSISSFFQKYVDFSGRASRSEFWYSYLFLFLSALLLVIIEEALRMQDLLTSVFSLATMLPTISMATRRLHDINRSGWLQLLGVCFPIGSIAVLVWYCTPPKDAEVVTAQSHGSDPKGMDQNRASMTSTQSYNKSDALDALGKLGDLRDRGIITPEEFEAEKRKILR